MTNGEVRQIEELLADAGMRECNECEMLREEIELLRDQKAELYRCIENLRARLCIIPRPSPFNPNRMVSYDDC